MTWTSSEIDTRDRVVVYRCKHVIRWPWMVTRYEDCPRLSVEEATALILRGVRKISSEMACSQCTDQAGLETRLRQRRRT